MRLFKTFFFGYLELKWRRLTRFLSFAIISICYGMLIDIRRVSEGGWVLLASPIIMCVISWLIEPFVDNKPPRIQQDNKSSFFEKKNWNLIGKVFIVLLGSLISYSFAIENGTFPYFHFAEYIGFAISPMLFSFPIYVFKGRKNFWYLFYKTSLYYWGLFIFFGCINIILKSI